MVVISLLGARPYSGNETANYARRVFNGGRGSCVVANSFLGQNETAKVADVS